MTAKPNSEALQSLQGQEQAKSSVSAQLKTLEEMALKLRTVGLLEDAIRLEARADELRAGVICEKVREATRKFNIPVPGEWTVRVYIEVPSGTDTVHVFLVVKEGNAWKVIPNARYKPSKTSKPKPGKEDQSQNIASRMAEKLNEQTRSALKAEFVGAGGQWYSFTALLRAPKWRRRAMELQPDLKAEFPEVGPDGKLK